MRLTLGFLFALAAWPAASAETGKAIFEDTCSECHTLGAASTEAPTLRGVVGRKIASLPDFQYSDGLKAKKGAWTEANLSAFLAKPQTFAPGTTMFTAVPSDADREALIDYLKTAK